MESQFVTVHAMHWHELEFDRQWVKALEAGKVLYLPNLGFKLRQDELNLLTPQLLAPNSRNISLDASSKLKGAVASFETLALLQALLVRYKEYSLQLIDTLLPAYSMHLRLAPTSFRPSEVETRVQSWRADDKRLHVDAFPSRPNRGERILRVFANVNPHGIARVWRVGEPFKSVAEQFLPRCKPYVAWQAKVLKGLGVTKSLRTEYDHLMLQMHDKMKSDLEYQKTAKQETVMFPSHSIWICFSDQTSHAAMSGQFMMEQTMHLSVEQMYCAAESPLEILSSLKSKQLI
jgi:3-deoxy-D-manno-oct-2-ulosonic acid (Kdo) hydroxylase